MAFVILLPLFPQLHRDTWTVGLLWGSTNALSVSRCPFPKSFLRGGKDRR